MYIIDNSNEKIIWLDVPPKILSERILVPLRAIAEGFGAIVTWDEATRTVNITVE